MNPDAVAMIQAVAPLLLGILGYLVGGLRRESEAGDKALKENVDKIDKRVCTLENAQLDMAGWCGGINEKLNNIEKSLNKLTNGKAKEAT